MLLARHPPAGSARSDRTLQGRTGAAAFSAPPATSVRRPSHSPAQSGAWPARAATLRTAHAPSGAELSPRRLRDTRIALHLLARKILFPPLADAVRMEGGARLAVVESSAVCGSSALAADRHADNVFSSHTDAPSLAGASMDWCAIEVAARTAARGDQSGRPSARWHLRRTERRDACSAAASLAISNAFSIARRLLSAFRTPVRVCTRSLGAPSCVALPAPLLLAIKSATSRNKKQMCLVSAWAWQL